MIQTLAAVALVGATVFTAGGPAIETGTVLIEGNRIVAVGSEVEIPADARIVALDGAVVTPGLVDPLVRLELLEIREHAPGPARAALRATDGFDPFSLAIPAALSGGLTSILIAPGSGLISGQSGWLDLVREQPVRDHAVALHMTLSTPAADPSARSAALLRLREALEAARLYRANRGPYITRRLRSLELSAADLEVVSRVLEGELKAVLEVDRAVDIRAALEIIREHRLDAVLLGVEEGWRVADEIAKSGVPVLIDPLADASPLAEEIGPRRTNALLLREAGVRMAFTTRGPLHRAHRLRFAAGNAVAAGFPYLEALAAITLEPARIFGVIDAGSIRPGALANIVVWNGDPLEVSSWATHVFIRGREVSLRSHQNLRKERNH